ncbi:MAG: aminotransferase, partial [Gammaproteobacteria bacterium]
EDFAGLVLYRDEYRPGARRYDAGERASQVMMPMAVAALEQVHAWGVAEIATTLAAFNTEIVDRAEQLGLSVPASAARAPHMLGVRFPKQVPDELFKALRDGGVHVSVRGSSIRIAPHLYNESKDIDRLFDVLAKAI